MNLIVHKLIILDIDSDKLYETGYKPHEYLAERIQNEVEDAGGIDAAIKQQLLAPHKENKWTRIS